MFGHVVYLLNPIKGIRWLAILCVEDGFEHWTVIGTETKLDVQLVNNVNGKLSRHCRHGGRGRKQPSKSLLINKTDLYKSTYSSSDEGLKIKVLCTRVREPSSHQIFTDIHHLNKRIADRSLIGIRRYCELN